MTRSSTAQSTGSCPADAFHNLVDVAKGYGLDKKQLIAYLGTAIDEKMNPKIKH